MSTHRQRMLQMSEQLRYHLALLKTIFTQTIQPFCDQEELTTMEMDILVFIFNHPQENTATGYAEARLAAKSNVSTSIHRLEERGYLIRQREHGNKKTIYLTLTEKGRKIAAQVSDCIVQEFMHLGNDISEKEAEQFIDIYSKIEKNLIRMAEETK